MKKKRLALQSLKVNSFITSLDEETVKTLKGGTGGPGAGGTQITCTVGPLCEGKDTRADGDCITQSLPGTGDCGGESNNCDTDQCVSGGTVGTGGTGIQNTIQLCG